VVARKDLQINALVNEIAEKAEGVFLWAFLVARSLREGLLNHGMIQELRMRLGELPRDLECLFRHILESVDRVYHAKMATMLLVTLRAVEPLLVNLYWHKEKEIEQPGHAMNCEVEPATVGSEQMHRRTNGISKGMLEIRLDHIEFLHRTVRDFLFTPGI